MKKKKVVSPDGLKGLPRFNATRKKGSAGKKSKVKKVKNPPKIVWKPFGM